MRIVRLYISYRLKPSVLPSTYQIFCHLKSGIAREEKNAVDVDSLLLGIDGGKGFKCNSATLYPSSRPRLTRPLTGAAIHPTPKGRGLSRLCPVIFANFSLLARGAVKRSLLALIWLLSFVISRRIILAN